MALPEPIVTVGAPIVTESGTSFVVKNHAGLWAQGPLPGLTIPNAAIVTLDHTSGAEFYADSGFSSVTEAKVLLERNADLITAYYEVRGIGDNGNLDMEILAPLRTTPFSGASDFKGYGVGGYADIVKTWDSNKKFQVFGLVPTMPNGTEAVVCFRVTYSAA
jgi:hypothetical protein